MPSKRSCINFLMAVASPVRIGILQALLEKSRNVTELQKYLNLERTLISHNLRRLLKVNLINYKKSGNERIYYANEELVSPLFFLLQNYCCSSCSIRGTCENLKKRNIKMPDSFKLNLKPNSSCNCI